MLFRSPHGFAIVGVDEIMEGFEGLELEYPIGEGEILLENALRSTRPLLGKTLAVALVLCSLVARVGALLIRRYSYCLAVMRAARATARTNSCSACSLPCCC